MESPFQGLEVDEDLRPVARSFDFDLSSCLSSVTVLEARVDDDAYTADALGTERIGNAVVLSPKGLVLTIGYLVTEADDVVLTTNDQRRVQAHVLGVDQVTGFGLLQALEPLDLPAMPLGDSRKLSAGDTVIAAGGGGVSHALSGQLLSRQPFSGYWEYHLDEALFIEPAHPHWSGAALINRAGALVGIGSLRMERFTNDGDVSAFNMFVPSELLAPILDDLASGRPAHPPRPWLGVMAQEVNSRIAVISVSPDGPAARAGLRAGDVIREVAGRRVADLAGFYGRLWALGPPGVSAPVTIQRGGEIFDIEVRTADRGSRLKKRRFN